MKRVTNLARKIYNSDLYILFCLALVLIGFTLNIWLPFVCLMTLFTLFGFIFVKEIKHFIPFACLVAMTMSSHAVDNTTIILVAICIALILFGLVFNVVYYKKSFSVVAPKNMKGFTFSLILLVIPFLFAGVGSEYGYTPTLVAFAIVLLIAIGYVLTFVGISGEKEILDYTCKTIFAFAVVVSVELIICLIRIGNIDGIISALQNKTLWVGWTGPNTTATCISMGVPCALYLCIKKYKLPYLFIPLAIASCFLMLLLIVLTGSRGAILFTAITLPAVLLFCMWNAEHKPTFFVSTSVVFVITIFAVATFIEPIKEVFSTIIDKGFSSSGRVEYIYPEAIALFKKYPIFGAGFGYNLSNNLSGLPQPYLFHSTFFQFLANMGVVGVIALVVFYLWKYFLVIPLIKKPSAVLITVSMLVFDLYSMIDTSIFNPFLFIILCAITLSLETEMPQNRCLAFFGKDPLKIFKKPKKD